MNAQSPFQARDHDRGLLLQRDLAGELGHSLTDFIENREVHVRIKKITGFLLYPTGKAKTHFPSISEK